jgi:PAS domain S-box-containing protein
MAEKSKNVITHRLIIGFSSIILFLIAFGVISFIEIQTLSRVTRTLYNHPLVVSNASLRATVSVIEMHRNMKDIVLSDFQSETEIAIVAMNEQELMVFESLDTVKKNILGDEGQELENETRHLFVVWKPIREEVIKLVTDGQRKEAAIITKGKGAEHVAKLENKMLELTSYARDRATGFMRHGDMVHTRIIKTTIIFVSLGLLFSVFIAFFIIRRTQTAEDALRESHHIIEGIINAIPVRVFWKDKNLVFLGCNALFAHDAGFSDPKDIIGKDDYQMGWRDQAELYRGDDRQVIESGGSKLLIEEPQTTPEGNTITLLTNKIPLRSSTGAISGVLGTYLDITERKQAEEALRESEKRYRELFENEQDALMILDAETKLFEDANQATLDLYGYTKSEFFKLTPEDISAEPEKTVKAVESIAKGIRDQRIPSRYQKKKDGTVFPAEITRGVFEIKGRRKIIGSIRDISDRKRAEDELKKERDRAQMYLDVAGVIFVALDVEGKVVLLNKKGCEILGYEEQEIIGKSWFDLCLLEPMRNEIKSAFVQLMKGFLDPIEYYENPVLTKNGEERYIAWHNALVRNEKGDIVGAFSSGEDITDRKRAEVESKKLVAQLQQAQKMESIGTLAGGIAHDFNNILFPMVGFAEMMLDDIPEDSRLRDSINEILLGTKRAGDLVNQILTFSRQTDQKIKPLKVQLIIKEVLKLIRSSLPSTIEVKPNLSNKYGLVMADATQIHQVAMNLMTNAYHAMEETGGMLEVTLKEIELGVDDLRDQSMPPGAYVCLTVADTGSGMDQSVVSRVFEPYFTTKKNGKGTGLGLAVVHGIVKSYKGDIRVYSKPGKGTAFHVYLPVIKMQVETEETEATEPVLKGTERILLVDDEDPIVRMEKKMLERLGYHITMRTSSTDALEAFRAEPDKFDLIITDMTMPNMTGVQLSKKLQEIRPDIPIILCTGFSEQINEIKTKAAGISGYVMKPIVRSELAKKIREAIDKEI